MLRGGLAKAMADAWFNDLRRDGVPEQEALKIVEEESMKRFTESPVLMVVCLTMKDMDRYPDERRMKAEYVMAVQSVAGGCAEYAFSGSRGGSWSMLAVCTTILSECRKRGFKTPGRL
jgi:hypothetical protein